MFNALGRGENISLSDFRLLEDYANYQRVSGAA
jgi:hypothetical protein